MNNNINNKKEQEEESLIDLSSIINILLGKWYWFTISIVLCIGIGLIKIYKSPKIYKKTASVLIKDSNNLGAVSGAASAFTDLAGMKMLSSSNTDNEMLILQSRSLMESVVLRLRSYITYYRQDVLREVEIYEILPFRLNESKPGLSLPSNFFIEPLSESEFRYSDDNVSFKENFNKEIIFPFGKAKIEAYPEIVSEYLNKKIRICIETPKTTINQYLGRFSVSLMSKTGTVVSLGFTATRPGKAEDLLNALFDQYNIRSIEDKNHILDASTNFIDKRLEWIKTELAEIDLRIEEYKKSNKTTGIINESSLYFQNANNLEEKISQNSIQIELVNSLYDFINNPINKRELLPYNIGLDNAGLNKQIQEYNENLIKLNRMITASSERNPLVQDLTAMLESTRISIDKTIKDMKNSLFIQQKELDIRALRATGKIESISVNERNVQSIARDQKIKEELYLYLLNKIEEISITKAMTESNGMIVDYADGSNYPVAPKKQIILLISIILGCIIPGVYFILKDLLNRKVRGKSDVLSVVSAPIIGEIPSKEKNNKESLLVKDGVSNPITEAFKILRTNLSFLVKEPKVIAITSSQSNEGKTYISMNIAATLSLTGKKVCMLDLDLRRRSLSTYFGKHKYAGVVEYIIGKESNLTSLIIPLTDNYDNLSILPAGTVPPNPAELLLRDDFDKLISELKSRFDYIVIDNPPVNIVADTKISNRCVDFTAYVVRAGVLNREELNIVEDIYQSKVLNNMGIILTDIDYEKLYYTIGYRGYGKGYGSKYAPNNYY